MYYADSIASIFLHFTKYMEVQYIAGHLSSYKWEIANSKLFLPTANPIIYMRS